MAIGVLGGLAAVGFHHLIDFFTERFVVLGLDVFGFLGRFAVVVPVVLGGLLVGPLVFRLAPEAKGHGVPEVMESVAVGGGRMRPRVVWVKALASAITIGSGGSAGREGPIVQVGSAIGSLLSRLFRMSDRRRSTYVAAGAGAGIAAVFNAPLAGVFFALEVILRSFTTRGFSAVVISAVTANATWRLLVGSEPVLDVAVYELESPVQLVFFAVLGVGAAVVALVFVKVLYAAEDWFETSPILGDLRPAVGALGVGLLGAVSIDVLGSGLAQIDRALAGEMAVGAMLLLIVGKIAATSLTLGSGGSGGIFSPSLLLGALLGYSYGDLVAELFPSVSGPAGAYSVVGMAAVFAAAAQAPMSAIFIVFEMTSDFALIMPLMLACALSTLTYTAVKRESIYTEKIRRKEVSLDPERDPNLMETTPLVRAAEAKYVATVEWASVEDAFERLERSREEVLLVISPDRALRGVVHRKDLEEARAADLDEIRSLIRDDGPIGRPDDSLESGMEKLEDSGLDVLPIVDWNERVLGVADRYAIVRAYEAAEAERADGGNGSSPP